MNELLTEIEGPGRIRAIEIASSSPDILALDDTCNPLALSASAKFWRVAMSEINASNHYDGMAKFLERRIKALRHQISCTPTDGTAWAELAEAEFEARRSGVQIMKYLEMSRKYAPYEQIAVTTRLRTLSSLANRGVRDPIDLFQNDLHTAIVYLDPDVAAEFNVPIEAQLSSLNNGEVSGLTRQRLVELRAAFERRQKNRPK